MMQSGCARVHAACTRALVNGEKERGLVKSGTLRLRLAADQGAREKKPAQLARELWAPDAPVIRVAPIVPGTELGRGRDLACGRASPCARVTLGGELWAGLRLLAGAKCPFMGRAYES